MTGERYIPGILGPIQVEHFHRYLFAMRFVEGRDVIDVASGEGYGSALLSQSARSVLGVDRDANIVKHANRQYGSPSLSFMPGDATHLPSSSAAADVVVSFETIEHLEDHEAFLSEVRRVLRPNGLLIISSPDRPVYDATLTEKNNFHLKELDRREFETLLSKYFLNSHVSEQRSIYGSVMLNSMESGKEGLEFFDSQDGTTFERIPDGMNSPFLVGLATDGTLPVTRTSILNSWAEVNRLRSDLELAKAEVNRLQTELAMRPPPNSPRLQVYLPSPCGYQEALSQIVTVKPNDWQCVTLDILEGVPSGAGAIRLDVADGAAIIDIRGISLLSAVDQTLVWSASGAALSDLRPEGTLMSISSSDENGASRFFSYGADPQLYLPSLEAGRLDQPLTLKVWLRLQTDLTALVPLLTGSPDSEPPLPARSGLLENLQSKLAVSRREQEVLVEQLEKKQASLIEEINRKQTKLYLLEDLRHELKQENDELRERSLVLEKTYVDLRDTFATLEASHSELQSSYQDLLDKHRTVDATLANVLRSHSWRLTAPLRSVTETLKR